MRKNILSIYNNFRGVVLIFVVAAILTSISNTHAYEFESPQEYVSKVVKPKTEFTAVGLTWNEMVPQYTSPEFQMRFLQKGVWSEWYAVPRDIDHKDEEGEHDQHDGMQTAFMAVNMSQAYQYRHTLSRDRSTPPMISNISITPIHAPFVASAKK